MKKFVAFVITIAEILLPYVVLPQQGTESIPCYSGMFNERGFTKSSSMTFSGSEMVNNFNGNLIYRKTLFDIPGRGDLNLKVELVYNGSVAHTSANRYYGTNHIYSITLPEWILSVNGIAVQVFNFEDEAYNKCSTSNGTATGRQVSTMVNGYHSCGRIIAENSTKDVVRILMGDGSVQEFFNVAVYPLYWDGEYHSSSPGDFSKGYIDEAPLGNRIFYLKPGDGTTVVFQEKIHTTADPFYQSGLEDILYLYNGWKPKVFYPVQIEDRFGNKIVFSYKTQYAPSTNCYGHPLVEKIDLKYGEGGTGITQTVYLEWGIGWCWSSQNGFYPLFNSVCVNGERISYVLAGAPYQNTDRYMISKIYEKVLSPEQLVRTTEFDYEGYSRIGNYLQPDPPDDWIITDRDITFYCPDKINVTAFRLKEVRFPEGGKSNYSYKFFDDSYEMQLDLKYGENPQATEVPYFQSGSFKTCGRDPFFTNMVEERKVYKKASDSVPIRYESYSYSWDSHWQQGDKKFYDSNDTFTTDLTIKTSNPEIGSTKTKFIYKNLPYVKIEPGYTVSGDYHFDLNFDTKLIQQEDGVSAQRVTFYKYDDLPALASMLIKEKKIQLDDVSFTETFNYQYEKWGTDYYAIWIASDTTTNPLGVKSVTEYNGDYRTSSSATSLYLTKLIKANKVLRKNGAQVEKKSEVKYSYFSNDLDPNGCVGQLFQKKDYPVLYSDSCITNYKYSKDPNLKGNLIEFTDPNNNLTKYYYDHVLSSQAMIQMPAAPVNPHQIQFKKKFNDESESIVKSDLFLAGYRFPVREENFITPTFSLNTFHNYDDGGLMTVTVDPVNNIDTEVGYGRTFEFDEFKRIKEIKLPFDFNSSEESPYDFTTNILYNDSPNQIATNISQRIIFSPDTTIKVNYKFNGLDQLYRIDCVGASGSIDSTGITYNYLDLKESDINANHHTTSYQYDGLQRLWKIVYPGVPEANAETITYETIHKSTLTNYPSSFTWPGDDFALVKTVRDCNQNTTKYYYDVMNQLRITQQQISAGVTQYTYFEYDDLGNLKTVKDPNGFLTAYTYDALSRVTGKNGVDFGQVLYRYDRNGNLRFVKDANQTAAGTFIYYKYDGLNRKIEEGIVTETGNLFNTKANIIDFPNDGSQTVKVFYKYDVDPGWSEISAGENLYGKLSGITYRNQVDANQWGFTTYSYDARGRIQWIQQLLPGADIGTKKIEYKYNSADLTTKILYNENSDDQFFIWYDYDEFGRMQKAFAAVTNSKPAYPLATYTYTPLGQVDVQTLKDSSGGTIQTLNHNYTAREWLDDISPVGNGAFLLDLGYDSVGNVTIMNQKMDADLDGIITDETAYGYNFGYDKIYRLTSATATVSPAVSVGYSYFPNGNIKGLVRGSANPPDQNYWYYANTNRLQYLTGQNTQNYQYDANGNVTKDLSKRISSGILYDYRNLPYQIQFEP